MKQRIDSIHVSIFNEGMDSVLEVSNLSLSFKLSRQRTQTVLDGINFNLPRGSLTGFIGINGSGKTTTLKAVLDFIRPQSGNIKFFGHSGFSSLAREKVGFLPERPYFYEYLTGKEFLQLHWGLHNRQHCNFRDVLELTLKKVNLEGVSHIKLRHFSKGMLQRIGMAQAILHQPELLILDEPMSGLDPDGRQLVKLIMRQLHQDGTTIFFSSHLLQDMEELCDRLVILDQGRVVFEGSLESIWALNPIQYRMEYKDTRTGLMHHWLGDHEKLQEKVDTVREEKLEIYGVSQRRPSLEEAFQVLRKKGS